jgi:hypothetical protein
MRNSHKAVLLLIVAAAFAGSGCSRGDRIIKVADLPQTAEFEVDARPEFAPPNVVRAEKVHIDVGYIWKQNKLLFMPILNQEGRYVGYAGSESRYIELKKGELEGWAARAGFDLSAAPSIPFWDAWGGKLLLIALIPPFVFLSLLGDRLWRRITTGM